MNDEIYEEPDSNVYDDYNELHSDQVNNASGRF